MINEYIKATGKVAIEVTRANGDIERTVQDNLVVTVGLAHIVSRMTGIAQNVISHMAIGSGSTVPDVADTTAEAELGRVALTDDAVVQVNVAGDSVQYTAKFPAGTGTGALAEACLFNADTAGTMLSRVTYDVINKGSGDAIGITWTITIA